MPHFKDLQNRIFWLDSVDVEKWKNPDWQEITDIEADEIRNPPKTAEQIAFEDSETAKAELEALDMASIRDIRAWLADRPDAPKLLKDNEAAAVLARSRVKP